MPIPRPKAVWINRVDFWEGETGLYAKVYYTASNGYDLNRDHIEIPLDSVGIDDAFVRMRNAVLRKAKEVLTKGGAVIVYSMDEAGGNPAGDADVPMSERRVS